MLLQNDQVILPGRGGGGEIKVLPQRQKYVVQLMRNIEAIFAKRTAEVVALKLRCAFWCYYLVILSHPMLYHYVLFCSFLIPNYLRIFQATGSEKNAKLTLSLSSLATNAPSPMSQPSAQSLRDPFV